MLPLLLAAVGGYLVYDSLKKPVKYADGGKLPDSYLNSQNSIKRGDIVKVVTPKHTATGSMFVFDSWSDDKTYFNGKLYPNEYGRNRMKRVYEAEIEIVPKNELNRMSKKGIEYRKSADEFERKKYEFERKKDSHLMADGGMMAKGGYTTDDLEKVGFRYQVIYETSEFHGEHSIRVIYFNSKEKALNFYNSILRDDKDFHNIQIGIFYPFKAYNSGGEFDFEDGGIMADGEIMAGQFTTDELENVGFKYQVIYETSDFDGEHSIRVIYFELKEKAVNFYNSILGDDDKDFHNVQIGIIYPFKAYNSGGEFDFSYFLIPHDKQRSKSFADGGMMADGGMLKYEVERDKDGTYLVVNNETNI